MLTNYLKLTFRNIWRHKGYSFINIFGLAIGLAACLLILLWVQDEWSYDRFHTNEAYLYRVAEHWQKEDYELRSALTAAPMGPAMPIRSPRLMRAEKSRMSGSVV